MPPEAVLAPPPGIERPRTKASGSSSRQPQRNRGGGHAAGRSRHAASQAEDASNASSNGTGRRRRDGRDGRDGRDSGSVAPPQPSPFANGTVSLMKREKPIEATEPQASTRPSEEPTASTSTATAINAPPTQPRATASSSSAAGGGLLQLPTEPRNHDPRPPRHHPKRSQDRGSRMSRGPSRNDPPERAPAGGGHPQLFDPMRHDALSFAKGLSSTSQSDARSSTAASTAPTSASAPSVASSEGRERGKRRPGSSRHGGSEQSGPSASGSKGSSTSRGANYLVNELKRIYRDISALETKLQEDHRKERAAAHAAEGDSRAVKPQVDHAFWVNLVEQHKRLIDLHYAFLDSALQPGLPPSLRSLPADYEIPVRVWQTGCHLLIESMRQSLPYPCGASSEDHVSERDRQTQAALLDHLNDFIYSAYIFYTNLLESEHLTTFRKCWLESLGDLARYRMLMARLAVQGGGDDASGSIRNKASREARRNEAASPQSFARIDDDSDDAQDAAAAAAAGRARPVDEASIGSAALGDWDLEEKETWRTTAKGWYAQGLAEMPGTGRLHHHLAVLSRADELKALHHFCKSLTAAQPYGAARESLLPLFDATHQRRRVEPGAGFIDLFVHLHGMMITKVQLDDFDAVLERYEEQLLTKVEALGWEHGIGAPQLMMMASINIAALMQYGADGAVLGGGSSSGGDAKKSNGSTTTTAAGSSKPTSPSPPQHSEGEELPIVLQCAIRLAFCTFAALFPNEDGDETHPPSISAALNPYVTMLCTLLFRLSKVPLPHPPRTEQGTHPSDDASSHTLLGILTRSIPWQRLASLSPIFSATSSTSSTSSSPQKITSAAPLPEDWCLRGLAWTGRKIFERDYWKPATTPPNPSTTANTTALPSYESEVDVLDEMAPDEAGQSAMPFGGESPSEVAMRQLRSHRVALALAALVDVVPGFDREEDGKGGASRIVLRPPLTTKLEKWAREDKERIEEEERLAKTTRALSGAALDDEEGSEVKTSDEDDDENEEAEDDSDSLRALKAKRRQLRAMLRDTDGAPASAAASKKGSASPAAATQQPLPGYTILVLDTNVFLTSPPSPSSPSSITTTSTTTPSPQSIAHHLITSHHWTTIVPLAVLTELDGLSRNTTSSSNVAQRAKEAVRFLEEGVRGATGGGGGTAGGVAHGHGKWLKVQTSRGNYLSDLKLRSEDIDLNRTRKGQGKDASSSTAAGNSSSTARTLDEVILSAFLWQLDHWVDRLPILCPSTSSTLPHSSCLSTTATSSTPPAAALPDLPTQRAKITEGQTPKVVLVTLDRGLRLRARAAISGRASTGDAEGKGCEGMVAGKEEIARLLLLATKAEVEMMGSSEQWAGRPM